MIYFIALACLLGFLFWNHSHWQADAWPQTGLSLPRYQNHRGYWQEKLGENSLPAFRESLKRGYKMIELDVQLSRDGIPVVLHDKDFKRLHQSSDLVAQLSFKEMKERFAVDSLDEVLADLSSKLFINIEIKSDKWIDSQLERAVIQLVRTHHAEAKVLFSSFNPLTIWRLHRLAPDIPRALLATQEADPKNAIYLRQLWLAPYVHPNILHLDHRFVSLEQLKSYQQRGIPVALWTVNDKTKIEDYFHAGVKSLISDLLPAEEIEPQQGS